MGPLSTDEKIMIGAVLLAVTLWVSCACGLWMECCAGCAPTCVQNPITTGADQRRLALLAVRATFVCKLSGRLVLPCKFTVIKHGCVWLQVSGSQLGVEPVTAAMLAVGCLLASGVLSWADCLAYTAAWDTLIWFTGALYRALPATANAVYAQPGVGMCCAAHSEYVVHKAQSPQHQPPDALPCRWCGCRLHVVLPDPAVLISMSLGLQSLGVIDAFSGYAGSQLDALGLPWPALFAALHLTYFLAHYMFASQTAHVGALFAAFCSLMISSGG